MLRGTTGDGEVITVDNGAQLTRVGETLISIAKSATSTGANGDDTIGAVTVAHINGVPLFT